MNSKATKRTCAKCQFEDDTGLKICPRDGSPMTSRGKDPLIGQMIADKYEILSMLGKGGMSVVYKAKHTMMNREVAVKMLRPELVAVPQLLQRFKQESNAVSALRHPNIVTVFDYGLISTSGTPYLIMDYLEGETLAAVIKRDHHLTAARAVPLFAQACDALAHAHDQGVIHRDIKPANLLIRVEKTGEESLTVFDFGIAKMLGQDGSTIHKLTTSGEVFGSPLYMSPEQCSGEHVGKKTDTYSLACVLYETLCGQPPLGGTSPMETLMKHVNEDPPTISEVNRELDIPAGLEDAIMQALMKDPADRQIDMREFRDQILEAGNLRILSSSLHLTRENTLAGQTEDVLASKPPRLTSGAVPQPPAKKKTTQRSQQLPAHKTRTVQKPHPDEPRKIPMPILIGLAIVIACGTMGGILFSLMKTNEAIVVKTEEPVTEEVASTPFNFDGKLILRRLAGHDNIQLSSLDKELKCRVDFEGQLSEAVPAPLLLAPLPDDGKHTDSNCIVIPVEISPSKISCAQAAEALFKKLFPDLKQDAWENITENFGDEMDPDTVLVQEITFPADAVSKADGTKPDDVKSEDATADESSNSDGAKPAGDAASAKVHKEYIVYLKQKDRLVACQFIPLTITEAQIEQTIKQFVPALKKVVKS